MNHSEFNKTENNHICCRVVESSQWTPTKTCGLKQNARGSTAAFIMAFLLLVYFPLVFFVCCAGRTLAWNIEHNQSTVNAATQCRHHLRKQRWYQRIFTLGFHEARQSGCTAGRESMIWKLNSILQWWCYINLVRLLLQKIDSTLL